MDLFLRIVLKASYVICIAFAILPVAYNNITERFVKSKALCFYNMLLTFIVLFVLPCVSITLFNATDKGLSGVLLNVFLLLNIVQWMSFAQLYYSVARKVNELIEVLNEGIDLLKNLHRSTKLPIRFFMRILLKHFIIDIFFYSIHLYNVLGLFKNASFYLTFCIIFFQTANKFFCNFYLMSLYFNAFLLEIINCKMQNTLKTIDNCRGLKHNITKHQFECICNEASDKIDGISIQLTKASNFVLKSSKLFPLAVIFSLNYSFAIILIYSFMTFEIIKLNMAASLEAFQMNKQHFVVIFYFIFAESINLFSFVHVCDCMKLKVGVFKHYYYIN